jgi:hypothetical protein
MQLILGGDRLPTYMRSLLLKKSRQIQTGGLGGRCSGSILETISRTLATQVDKGHHLGGVLGRRTLLWITSALM